MRESINWLFLTDLHLGLDERSWLWPRVKHDLFKDIAKVAEQVGAWDLVFFTGDFTQTGSSTEFDRVSRELEDLWKVLSKGGTSPLLCPVPGNHDLTRPSAETAVARTLTQLWATDANLRSVFWRDKSCEYRMAVDEYFRNYTNWLLRLPVPVLPSVRGILPGDFSAIFQKGGVQLGVVGLNSTFLQLATGDFKGKLDLHVSQLNGVCDGDPSAWIGRQTAGLLLTHQPPSWLSADALAHYRQEIYPPGRFLSHLFGHQHIPETLEITEAGGLPRRYRQGSSVFGLENWYAPTPTKRIHGYMAGQFVFDGANSIESFWPRTAVQGRDGSLNLCPDHTFKLQGSDNVVVPFELGSDDDDSQEDSEATQVQTPVGEGEVHAEPAEIVEIHPLDGTPDPVTSRSRLATCPRFSLACTAQHRAVRQEEQSQFELEIRRGRVVWLVADWGAGQEGFLASALERFRDKGSELDVFHLRCDDADDENAFQSLFPQQFGMSMQAFCSYVTSLVGAFLFLDSIHPSLRTGANLLKLRQIAAAMLDYCPELRLVFLSRTPPDQAAFPLVDLHPLEVPDVRTYLLHHPDATAGLSDPDVIDKLHERSDGLPMHLDRMLRSLKVSSLESVLDSEMEGPSPIEPLLETVPKALVHAVSSLAKAGDKGSRRSLLLLKVLSVLPYGETLGALSHYINAEPFFPANALQLHELGLLDAIPLQHSSPCVGLEKGRLSEESSPKLLKVPRQIGRYVLTLLSDEERAMIILAGMEIFFGRRWRDGKIKLRTIPLQYREFLSTGAGNEFAVVHHLIVDSRKNGDTSTVRRAARLGIQYCHRLKNEERFRDLLVVAGGLLQTIGRDEMCEQWSELSALHGEALRMVGKDADALAHLRGALEAGENVLKSSQQASIWLEIALAEERLHHVELSVEAAAEVRRLAKPLSSTSLHAVAIEAGLTLKGAEKTQRLTELEKEAREQGKVSLADTIALKLAHDIAKPADEIRLLDRVLGTKARGYNQTRAVVAKARAIEKIPNGQVDLTMADQLALSSAYTYLYSQRFGSLFDQCHAALWNLLESRGDTPQLYRLFRHTSFVWRIRGEEAKEATYLNRLSEKTNLPTEVASATGVRLEVMYFLRRLKLVVKPLLGARTAKGSQ